MGKAAKIGGAIALDSKKQKTFARKVTKLRKQVKKSPKKPIKSNTAYLGRGLVYLSHIPEGFFESEIKQYFRQFGKVTNVRVLRSHNTGRSKGAAFVEFKLPEVAQIAAETMNNYLMFKRRIEAKYIQPGPEHMNLFDIHLSPVSFPKKKRQNDERARKHKVRSDMEHRKIVTKQLRKLKKNGMLDCCQVVNMDFEVEDLQVNKVLVKPKEKVASKNKTIKPTKSPKTTEKPSKVMTAKKEPNETFTDDSLIINEPVVKSAKKTKASRAKTASPNVDKALASPKEVKKSLKTIKKTKEKKSEKSLVLKPEILEKIVLKPKTGKAKKTQLMLDPELVKEVKFSAAKGKKALASPGKKVKKLQKQ